MVDAGLQRRRILVVEDEYILAAELCAALTRAGAIVIGPAGTLNSALDLITREPRIDSAILDLNLSGARAFPVADRLLERGVPIVFTTGYDMATLPERYGDIPRCEKPLAISQVLQVVGQLKRTPRGESADEC